MNRRFARALLMAGGLALVARAAGEIYLVGVAQEGAVARVSLHDTETRLAAWVAVGETFRGNKIIAVSAKHDEVTLQRDTGEYRIRLQDAVVEPYDDPRPEVRDERFHRALSQVQMDRLKNNSRTLTAEEFIQMAAKFGRVVLLRKTQPEQDVIVVGLPGTDSDPRGKDLFRVTYGSKDGSRGCTLMIR